MTTRTTATGRVQVLDPVRRRWVALTPEEAVRQHLLDALVAAGYPVGLLAVEKAIVYHGRTWRADVVAYGRDGRALVLAECKAPSVRLGPDTLDQLARYNVIVGAPVLVLDNGAQRVVGRLDGAAWSFLDAIPPFAGG